jgi:hypothetical protein
MSLCIFIQPGPLLHELTGMATDDGFIDRLLFAVVKPRQYKSTTTRSSLARLQAEFPEDIFASLFKSIFRIHREESITYIFDEEAQEYFDKLHDDKVEDFNRMYAEGT